MNRIVAMLLIIESPGSIRDIELQLLSQVLILECQRGTCSHSYLQHKIGGSYTSRSLLLNYSLGSANASNGLSHIIDAPGERSTDRLPPPTLIASTHAGGA